MLFKPIGAEFKRFVGLGQRISSHNPAQNGDFAQLMVGYGEIWG